MTSDSDFKRLVRERMAATGARYTEAHASLRSERAETSGPMVRRVMGLKMRYALRVTGPSSVSAAIVAETMFRRVATWGRPVNVFLENGGRLQLLEADADRHPAFAGPECDSIIDAVHYDQVGDAILAFLARSAEELLAESGTEAIVDVVRPLGRQSESYLIRASVDAASYLRSMASFLASRWVMSGATTSVPTAGLADDAFAGEGFRRLQISGCDGGHDALTAFVKLAATEQVLRLVEAGRDVRATADCTTIAGALEAQEIYLRAARQLDATDGRPEDAPALDAWEQVLADVAASAGGTNALEVSLPRNADHAGVEASVDGQPAQESLDLNVPPATTRARLRGAFISRAKHHRRSYTVDWTHLRLIDIDTTVRCPDPLAADDERALEIIELVGA